MLHTRGYGVGWVGGKDLKRTTFSNNSNLGHGVQKGSVSLTLSIESNLNIIGEILERTIHYFIVNEAKQEERYIKARYGAAPTSI